VTEPVYLFSEIALYQFSIENILKHTPCPLSGAGLLSSLIPLLRGDKGVCLNRGFFTHPCPSQEGIFLRKLKELNSPASQEGIFLKNQWRIGINLILYRFAIGFI